MRRLVLKGIVAAVTGGALAITRSQTSVMPASDGMGATFGRYLGEIVTKWRDDGRMELVQPFVYIDRTGLRWEAPAGLITDGASIPVPFWKIIGSPFQHPWRKAAVIHDYFCMTRVRPWQRVHEVFYEALMAAGVEPWRAKVMYAAVHRFGPRWEQEVRILPPVMAPQESRPSCVQTSSGCVREPAHDKGGVTRNMTPSGEAGELPQPRLANPENVLLGPNERIVKVETLPNATQMVLVESLTRNPVTQDQADELVRWIEQNNPSIEQIQQGAGPS